MIDLKIQKGKILARVQGTRKTPYKVEIRISPLSEEKCQSIIARCGKKLENPLLFFELRGIEVGRFIDVTLANRVEAMLANAGNKSSRIMDGDEAAGLFGVL